MPRSPEPATDAAACRRRALDLLARREHSRHELERKLLDRAYAAETVSEVLDRLEVQGLLDARRFVESFVRSRVSKLQGPVRIRAELAQRGIDGRQADALLESSAHDWTALAARARVKRFGPAPPVDLQGRARQARFLRNRGFEPRQIDAALDLATETD